MTLEYREIGRGPDRNRIPNDIRRICGKHMALEDREKSAVRLADKVIQRTFI